MLNLNYTMVDIECPNCSYQDTVLLVDVKSEKTIFCHNCKICIQLIDSQASVHNNIQSLNDSLRGIENLFRNL